MIARRELLAGIGALAAAPRVAAAQSASATPRVGYVSSASRNVNADAFEQGMRALGYDIGRNVVIEYRFADGRQGRVPAFVAELLRLKIDVLLASNPHSIHASRQASGTVPIVASISRPIPSRRAGSRASLDREGISPASSSTSRS